MERREEGGSIVVKKNCKWEHSVLKMTNTHMNKKKEKMEGKKKTIGKGGGGREGGMRDHERGREKEKTR